MLNIGDDQINLEVVTNDESPESIKLQAGNPAGIAGLNTEEDVRLDIETCFN